jgi:hypothetical protein
MSIHKVTNIFVGNGSALEADVNTLTPGKLGVFKADQTALGAATPYVAGTSADSIQFSETFPDGTFKKSMLINGLAVKTARFEKYVPAQREVWAIGYDRKLATGEIEVNASSDYTASIRFKNDKSLYSERPEVLRINFTSSVSATQLTIATQVANAINNGSFKSLISALIVGNGSGAMGLTNATKYGVEITAKDIEQFQSSTFKENRVYFSCHVDDSTGFGSTTTCTQIVANSYGEGTYNQIYNKENFEYQYEGLSNRRLWPAQAVKFNVVNTGYLSGSVVAAATTPTGALSAASTGILGANTVTYDVVEVATSTAGLRAGEIITLNSVQYEIKYIISATKFVITTPLTAVVAGTAFLVKYFYDTLTLTFADNAFTSGADLINQAQKAVVIATPSINAGSADPFDRTLDTASFSTEGVALLTNVGAWLAGTPTKISTAVLIA